MKLWLYFLFVNWFILLEVYLNIKIVFTFVLKYKVIRLKKLMREGKRSFRFKSMIFGGENLKIWDNIKRIWLI